MSTSETRSDAASAATASLPLEPGRWQVDQTHSGISFAIRHLGISKVRGRFGQFDAWLQVGDSLDGTLVQATVDMASVDTNNADRDNHLRTPDFLDVENHPEMTFHSTRISGAGEDWQMAGDLTILGRTHPFAFDVEFYGIEEFELDGSRRAGFGATGKLKRSELGLDFTLPVNSTVVLGDVVSIDLDLQFVAPTA